MGEIYLTVGFFLGFMDVVLDVRKSVEENAAVYFEKSKKAKRKLGGAEKALRVSEALLSEVFKKKSVEESQDVEVKSREKRWFEKFRWFVSSEGFLCIGGRDVSSNEIVVKKHSEKNDVVFHTQMQGSPFFVIKSENREIGEATLEEAGVAVACFSRAWRLGMTNVEVFHVLPSQLSKTARAGEYVERGAFVISGKINARIVSLELAVGMKDDGLVMCGPVSAVKKSCGKFVIIRQGGRKSSDAARVIRKKIGGELDDIVRVLPSGGVKIA